MWPLAPNPPCEQVLAAVGVGCWALVPWFSSSPCPLSLWPRRTCEPPYKQMLIGMGRVRSFSPPPSPSAPRCRSPCCVPHLTAGWVVSSPVPLTHPPPSSRPCAPTPHIHPASSCSQQWWCWQV